MLESQLNEVDQHRDAILHLQNLPLIEDNHDIALEQAESVLSVVGQLSLDLLTRYAGLGYNLLTGNPGGSNMLGGTRFLMAFMQYFYGFENHVYVNLSLARPSTPSLRSNHHAL